DCLYLSSAMAVLLCQRHEKPVLVSQNIGLIRYAFPPLTWIERAAYATLGHAVLRHASHVVLATPTAAAHVRTLFPAGGLRGASLPRRRPAARGTGSDGLRPARTACRGQALCRRARHRGGVRGGTAVRRCDGETAPRRPGGRRPRARATSPRLRSGALGA